MHRRQFVRLAATGAVAAIAFPLGLAGCAAPRLANAVSLEDKTKAPVVDLSVAIAGEPELELRLAVAESCRAGMEALTADYRFVHPNIAFSDTAYVPTAKLAATVLAGGFDGVVCDLGSVVTELTQAGAVNRPLSASPFVTNLVMVSAPGSALEISSVEDAADDAVKRIVIGNPDAVFSGASANQALNSAGLYTAASGLGGEYDPSIAGKVVLADSLADVADAVASDESAIGFMAACEAAETPQVQVAAPIMRTKYRSMPYIAAPLADSARTAYIVDFIDYCINDDEAQRIEVRYGLSDEYVG